MCYYADRVKHNSVETLILSICIVFPFKSTGPMEGLKMRGRWVSNNVVGIISPPG